MLRGSRWTKTTMWTAVVVWAAVIFRMSALPGSQVPGRFGSLAHFVEYAVLGALLQAAIAIDRPARTATLTAVSLASVYAVTDEFHQSFVPMRTPDPMDWAIDTIGALVGALVALGISRASAGRTDRSNHSGEADA